MSISRTIERFALVFLFVSLMAALTYISSMSNQDVVHTPSALPINEYLNRDYLRSAATQMINEGIAVTNRIIDSAYNHFDHPPLTDEQMEAAAQKTAEDLPILPNFIKSDASLLSQEGHCDALQERLKEAVVMQRQYCSTKYSPGIPPQDDMQEVRLKVHNGTNIPMYIYKDNDDVSHEVKSHWQYEPATLGSIVRWLSRVQEIRGSTAEQVSFLDIGAGIGTHTLHVLDAGFGVMAFEPHPTNQVLLRQNLCMNDPTQAKVLLFDKGFGVQPGECDIYSKEDNVGAGKVYCDGTLPAPDINAHKVGSVDMVRLDDFLLCTTNDTLSRFGVVKISVEGFEAQVVDGGSTFFHKARPPFVVMEWKGGWTEDGQKTPEELTRIARYFFHLGYKASCGKPGESMTRHVIQVVDCYPHIVFAHGSILAMKPPGESQSEVVRKMTAVSSQPELSAVATQYDQMAGMVPHAERLRR